MTDTTTPAPAQPVAVAIAPASRASWRDLVPAVTLLLAVIAALLGGGQLLGEVANNTRRIEALERGQSQLAQIDVRLAKIETKLELLLSPTHGRELAAK